MRTRKFNLIFVSFIFMLLLFGCSNKSDGYSGGYSIQNKNENVDITTNNELKKIENHTTTATNSSAMTVSTTTQTDITTTVAISTTVSATTVNNIDIPNDSLLIKENTIFLTYGIPNQDLVDNSEAVYDTGEHSNEYNTVIFGHAYKSFTILDSVEVGETIFMNYHGFTKSYEVTRSERATISQNETEIRFVSDNEEVVKTNYGYHGLVLVTCDKQDDVNYRWIVVAKEIV